MESEEKYFKEEKKYKIMTKKIETVLSIITLFLFMFSLSGGTGSSIAFFTVTIIIFIYYFAVYRKKQYYVVLDGGTVTVYDGILLKPVNIHTASIRKVTKAEKEMVILFDDNGSEKSIGIKAFILSPEDFKELYDKLA